MTRFPWARAALSGEGAGGTLREAGSGPVCGREDPRVAPAQKGQSLSSPAALVWPSVPLL